MALAAIRFEKKHVIVWWMSIFHNQFLLYQKACVGLIKHLMFLYQRVAGITMLNVREEIYIYM